MANLGINYTRHKVTRLLTLLDLFPAKCVIIASILRVYIVLAVTTLCRAVYQELVRWVSRRRICWQVIFAADFVVFRLTLVTFDCRA